MKKFIILPDSYTYKFKPDGRLEWIDIKPQLNEDVLFHRIKYDPFFIPFNMEYINQIIKCYKDIQANGFYIFDEKDNKFIGNGVIDFGNHDQRAIDGYKELGIMVPELFWPGRDYPSDWKGY